MDVNCLRILLGNSKKECDVACYRITNFKAIG